VTGELTRFCTHYARGSAIGFSSGGLIRLDVARVSPLALTLGCIEAHESRSGAVRAGTQTGACVAFANRSTTRKNVAPRQSSSGARRGSQSPTPRSPLCATFFRLTLLASLAGSLRPHTLRPAAARTQRSVVLRSTNPCGGVRQDSPDRARRPWASARLSAIECSRRDPSVTRSRAPSQRDPDAGTGFVSLDTIERLAGAQ
jgi:hypothetical protein